MLFDKQHPTNKFRFHFYQVELSSYPLCDFVDDDSCSWSFGSRKGQFHAHTRNMNSHRHHYSHQRYCDEYRKLDNTSPTQDDASFDRPAIIKCSYVVDNPTLPSIYEHLATRAIVPTRRLTQSTKVDVTPSSDYKTASRHSRNEPSYDMSSPIYLQIVETSSMHTRPKYPDWLRLSGRA